MANPLLQNPLNALSNPLIGIIQEILAGRGPMPAGQPPQQPQQPGLQLPPQEQMPQLSAPLKLQNAPAAGRGQGLVQGLAGVLQHLVNSRSMQQEAAANEIALRNKMQNQFAMEQQDPIRQMQLAHTKQQMEQSGQLFPETLKHTQLTNQQAETIMPLLVQQKQAQINKLNNVGAKSAGTINSTKNDELMIQNQKENEIVNSARNEATTALQQFGPDSDQFKRAANKFNAITINARAKINTNNIKLQGAKQTPSAQPVQQNQKQPLTSDQIIKNKIDLFNKQKAALNQGGLAPGSGGGEGSGSGSGNQRQFTPPNAYQNTIGNVAPQIVSQIPGVIAGAGEAIGNKMAQVPRTVSDILASAGKTVSPYVDQAVETIDPQLTEAENAGKKILGGFQEAGNAIGNTLSQTPQMMQQGYMNIVAKLKQMLPNATDDEISNMATDLMQSKTPAPQSWMPQKY